VSNLRVKAWRAHQDIDADKSRDDKSTEREVKATGCSHAARRSRGRTIIVGHDGSPA